MKRYRNRTTKWNIIFQYLNIVFNLITGIVLVPFYLENITTEMYGYWLATGSILAMITLVDPGFGTVLQQKIAILYGQRNFKEVGQITLIGILINIPFLIIFIILCLIFSFTLTHWFNLTDINVLNSLTNAFNYTFIGTAILLLSYSIISINQGLQSSIAIGIINVFSSLSGIFLTIFLLKIGWGIAAIATTILWRSIVVFIGNLVYLGFRLKKENITLSYNPKLFKEIASFSIYTFLGKMGNAFSTQLNSFVSGTMISATSVSILKFTQILPETSKTVIDRPAYALMPALSNLYGENDSTIKIKAIILRFLRFILWGIGIIAIIFFKLNQSFVYLWVGDEFYGGYLLNNLIIILVILTLLSNSLSYFVFALGNIKKSNLMLFWKSLLLVPMLFLGAHHWGLVGILTAQIIAELLIPTWYFPFSLFKMIRCDKNDIISISSEFFKVLLVVLPFLIISNPILTKWLTLIIYGISYCCIYFCLIFLVSKKFRMEINDILMQIRVKLHLI